MLSISIGPLSLPIPMLLLFVAVVLGLGVARFVSRGQEQSASDVLLMILVVALLFGRLVFVLRFADSYQTMWQMLDIRDRGIDISTTIMAAMVLLFTQVKRLPELKTALVSGAACTLICYAVGSAWLYSQQQQQVLADIQLETLSGDQAVLADMAQGKPVVLNIWASWCPPCRREMPLLLNTQQQAPDISVIMLNLQESRTTVAKYLRNHQLDFQQVLLDKQGDVARYYGALGVPATLFFRADGSLSSVHFGELSQATLQQGIDTTLN